MVAYLDPLLRKKRYLHSHFDDVISRYREKEMTWERPPANITAIWDRLMGTIKEEFGLDLCMIAPHVIDLHREGHIGETAEARQQLD
jgi:hypothetical protein